MFDLPYLTTDHTTLFLFKKKKTCAKRKTSRVFGKAFCLQKVLD